ncbi:hypothetical protein, partial [Aneurinibacillus migulanus]
MKRRRISPHHTSIYGGTNRNPLISINPLEPLTSIVPTDTITISGTVNDLDEGDTVTMEYKLNQGPFQP